MFFTSSEVFCTSAHENADDPVTLSLHRGTSGGQTVFYVITDTSDGWLASSLGVNKSPKTGANNPQRQGLNSAILDGQDPLNVLR